MTFSHAMEDPVLARWRGEAELLKRSIVTSDTLPYDSIRFIGGLDLSFVPGDDTAAVACLVVSSFPECKIVYEEFRMVELTQPYIPGFLAFREADFLVALLETMREREPQHFPQVVLVDGNGILHQQGVGLACHVGVRANVCAIGVAKTFLQVDGLDWESIKSDFQSKCQTAQSWLPLIGASGVTWGAAVATVADLKKPVFVSLGHGVTLETALRILFAVSRYRQPEPIRHADLRSRAFIRELEKRKKRQSGGNNVGHK